MYEFDDKPDTPTFKQAVQRDTQKRVEEVSTWTKEFIAELMSQPIVEFKFDPSIQHWTSTVSDSLVIDDWQAAVFWSHLDGEYHSSSVLTAQELDINYRTKSLAYDGGPPRKFEFKFDINGYPIIT